MIKSGLVLLMVLGCAAGCVSAKVAGQGVHVTDQAHFIDVQANSFNAEVNINAGK